jgi:hypothetical protein
LSGPGHAATMVRMTCSYASTKFTRGTYCTAAFVSSVPNLNA